MTAQNRKHFPLQKLTFLHVGYGMRIRGMFVIYELKIDIADLNEYLDLAKSTMVTP